MEQNMSDRKSTDKLKIIFLEAAHQAGQSATRENLEAQKDFFRRIGLNPVLKSRKLSYSYHLPWSILAD
ncbi:MAG TPA: hypothetical protein VI895_06055, partial [Bdellovibrionota bacterium]|nr:hypothetical protein [Bdellovibrionota bacterium]